MMDFPFAEELRGFRYFGPRNIEQGSSVLSPKGQPLVSLRIPEGDSKLPERIVAAITNAGVSGISVLDGGGVQKFVDFAFAAARTPELLGASVISMGFGGSTGQIPLRAPSYIVPALRIMKSFQNMNLPVPRLRVFSGQSAAAAVNGFDLGKMWEKTLKIFVLCRLHALKFFPEISSEIFFDFDYLMAEDEEVRELARQLQRQKSNRAGLPEVLNFLLTRGKAHGGQLGEDGALLYIALHPILFGDWLNCGSGWLRCFTEQTFPPFRISLGGPPERFFNIGRLILGDMRRVQPVGNLMFLLENGAKPVYYTLEDEPVFSSDAVHFLLGGGGDLMAEWLRFQKNAALAEDFRILAGDRAEVFTYLDWAREVAELYDLAAMEGDDVAEILAMMILSPQLPHEWNQIVNWLSTALSRLSSVPADRRGEFLKQGRELLQQHESTNQIIREIFS